MDTNLIYLVAWTGGYENPDFAFFTDEAAAWEQYEAWKADMDPEDGHVVNLTSFDPATDAVQSMAAA